MNLTQLKKWFTILSFVFTALLVTRTATAESRACLDAARGRWSVFRCIC